MSDGKINLFRLFFIVITSTDIFIVALFLFINH